MENKEKFDPQARDSSYYSNDPYQHGDSDYGAPSQGVGAGEYPVQGIDASDEQSVTSSQKDNYRVNDERESGPDNVGTDQEWDVDPAAIERSRHNSANAPEHVSSGLPSSVEGIPDNPSDEALFNRKGATYLEQNDNPGQSYDPHHVGYDDKDKE